MTKLVSLILVLLAVFSVLGTAAAPFIHSEGTLTMSFTGVSPEITLQTDLELGWRGEGWLIGGTATMTEGQGSGKSVEALGPVLGPWAVRSFCEDLVDSFTVVAANPVHGG